jgi:hypothetical protein
MFCTNSIYIDVPKSTSQKQTKWKGVRVYNIICQFAKNKIYMLPPSKAHRNQRKYLRRFYYILQFTSMCKHVFTQKNIGFYFGLMQEHILMGL